MYEKLEVFRHAQHSKQRQEYISALVANQELQEQTSEKNLLFDTIHV